jgi:hypothetical protein
VTVLAVVLAIMVADILLRTIFRREAPVRKDRPAAPALRWLRVAVNIAGFVTLALVTWTALFHGEGALTGDSLIRHVSMAPPFAVAAVAVALFWAHRNRLSSGDWGRGWALPLRKIFFWIAIALAIPTFVSILAAMFPLADTEGQQSLIRIHRLCGPWLAGAGLLFAYFALMSWREKSAD